ncbi:MAG: helix-turn-helix domain-containing protein [Gammaproteobacteria bacterium]|nr:helix-turn-helix domain-containing protein [Gammaproteobacteria bacterium]
MSNRASPGDHDPARSDVFERWRLAIGRARPSASLVLPALASFAGADNKAWPTVATLSRLTGVSTRNVKKELKRLRDEKVIIEVGKRRGENGQPLQAVYTILYYGGRGDENDTPPGEGVTIPTRRGDDSDRRGDDSDMGGVTIATPERTYKEPLERTLQRPTPLPTSPRRPTDTPAPPPKGGSVGWSAWGDLGEFRDALFGLEADEEGIVASAQEAYSEAYDWHQREGRPASLAGIWKGIKRRLIERDLWTPFIRELRWQRELCQSCGAPVTMPDLPEAELAEIRDLADSLDVLDHFYLEDGEHAGWPWPCYCPEHLNHARRKATANMTGD